MKRLLVVLAVVVGSLLFAAPAMAFTVSHTQTFNVGNGTQTLTVKMYFYAASPKDNYWPGTVPCFWPYQIEHWLNKGPSISFHGGGYERWDEMYPTTGHYSLPRPYVVGKTWTVTVGTAHKFWYNQMSAGYFWGGFDDWNWPHRSTDGGHQGHLGYYTTYIQQAINGNPYGQVNKLMSGSW